MNARNAKLIRKFIASSGARGDYIKAKVYKREWDNTQKDERHKLRRYIEESISWNQKHA